MLSLIPVSQCPARTWPHMPCAKGTQGHSATLESVPALGAPQLGRGREASGCLLLLSSSFLPSFLFFLAVPGCFSTKGQGRFPIFR